MPTVMVERATAQPFETKWLSWLGPWRMSFGISQMEHEREDIDAPLFMAWRVEIMPFKDIEIGFSRTAQFCGEQLECNLGRFLEHAHRKRQRRYRRDAGERARQPDGGIRPSLEFADRQLAVRRLLAVHRRGRIELRAGEVPRAVRRRRCGSRWRTAGWCRGSSEYSTTTCSANTDRGPYYNCAYNQGRFNVEGYRYHGRVIGYTADRDAENYVARRHLHRAGRRNLVGDGAHVAAQSRRFRRCPQYRGLRSDRLQLARVRVARQVVRRAASMWISESKSIEPEGGERDVQPYGFIRWTHAFGP